MRIIQLVESLEVGGLERVALDLGREFAARGHATSFHCLFDRGRLAIEAEAAGLRVTAYHKPAGFSPALLARLAWRLLVDSPDVLLTHNLGAHAYGALAGAVARVPVVVSVRHGFISSQGQPFREDRFRNLLRFTDAVVCVSEHTRRHFVENKIVPAALTSVIYNGIPVDRFSPGPRPPAADRPLRFGTVGRMVPVKGHAMLIDAFARFLPSCPQATLRIVGGGELEPALRHQVEERDLAGHVSIEPLCSEVAEFFHSIDVFAFSSFHEGLPVVILEAMAAGLPIVSTRVGGVPEVAPAGEVAWYSEPGDVEAFTANLRLAAQAPDSTRRGARARQLACQRYSTAAMANGYLDLFRARGARHG